MIGNSAILFIVALLPALVLADWNTTVGGTHATLTLLNATVGSPPLLVTCTGGCFGAAPGAVVYLGYDLQGNLTNVFYPCATWNVSWFGNEALNGVCVTGAGTASVPTVSSTTDDPFVGVFSVFDVDACDGTQLALKDTGFSSLGFCFGQSGLVYFAWYANTEEVVSRVDMASQTVTTVRVPLPAMTNFIFDVSGAYVAAYWDDKANSNALAVVSSAGNVVRRWLVGEGVYVAFKIGAGDVGYLVVNDQVSAIDIISGALLYNVTLSISLSCTDGATFVNDIVEFGVDDMQALLITTCGGVAAVETRSGFILWQWPITGAAVTPAVHPPTGALLVSDAGEGLFALNPRTGNVVWTQPDYNVPIASGGQLTHSWQYVAASNAAVRVGTNSNTNEPTLFSVDVSGVPQLPAVAKSVVKRTWNTTLICYGPDYTDTTLTAGCNPAEAPGTSEYLTCSPEAGITVVAFDTPDCTGPYTLRRWNFEANVCISAQDRGSISYTSCVY